ncbi:MAG: DUF3874 domain-containing protein [Tannerellaceae bacterium]|nr:DUF3874 domain-containing protein [Tannerellaceae bacterium]
MYVFLLKESYVAPRRMRMATVMEWMRDEKRGVSVLACRESLQQGTGKKALPERMWPPFLLFNVPEEYAGVVLVEADGLADDAEVKRIRRKAAESPQTLGAFMGLDGRSVKILVRFSLPGGELPQDKERIFSFHAQAYLQAVNYYGMQLGHTIAVKPVNVEQRCRFSYDPELYFNPGALVITQEQPMQAPVEMPGLNRPAKAPEALDRLMPGMERARQVSLLYETSLKEALESLGGLCPGDAKAFLTRLAENCYRSGIPEEETVRWSMLHSELAGYETELRATVRNVYLLNKPFGQKPCIHPAQLLALQLDEFMKRRYVFRRNELKREVEYHERNSYYGTFHPVTEEALNTISLQAHTEGLSFWDRDVKRYIYSNLIPVYNPVDHYLDTLPVWDGNDHIRALASTVPTDNTAWPHHFYRWFLGLAAQWKQMNRTHANSVVPLLVGSQGCGKSTWCRNLLPPELRAYYTDSIDFGSKRETEMALHRFALINLDEFDSIRLGQQPYLKHLLQKPEANIRRPHKSSIVAEKRYGVFIATCNHFDLLGDPTGSRRFLCVEVDGQIGETAAFPLAQAYAQALAALRSGERYWFDRKEEALLMENNLQFQQTPVEEQLLLQYFTFVNEPEGEGDGEWLAAIEIINRLQKRSKIKIGEGRIRHFCRILSRHEIPMKHTRSGNAYWVKEI